MNSGDRDVLCFNSLEWSSTNSWSHNAPIASNSFHLHPKKKSHFISVSVHFCTVQANSIFSYVQQQLRKFLRRIFSREKHDGYSPNVKSAADTDNCRSVRNQAVAKNDKCSVCFSGLRGDNECGSWRPLWLNCSYEPWKTLFFKSQVYLCTF